MGEYQDAWQMVCQEDVPSNSCAKYVAGFRLPVSKLSAIVVHRQVQTIMDEYLSNYRDVF